MNKKNEDTACWKGIKGFGPDMVCEPKKKKKKQYIENTVFEEASGTICGEGMMHYVVEPIAVFDYYPSVTGGKKMNMLLLKHSKNQ